MLLRKYPNKYEFGCISTKSANLQNSWNWDKKDHTIYSQWHTDITVSKSDAGTAQSHMLVWLYQFCFLLTALKKLSMAKRERFCSKAKAAEYFNIILT